MEIRLDLHIHSEYSPDGRMSIEEIVEQAKKAGLNGVAVCDHDRVWTGGGIYNNNNNNNNNGIEGELSDFYIISGVEISTEYGHLLGWFVDKPIETRNFMENKKYSAFSGRRGSLERTRREKEFKSERDGGNIR